MACVDVPALPLQLLMRRRPAWAAQPAAVVDRDRPQGVVEWVNEPARRAGVLPGMSYAAGLSLAGALRAAEVPAGDVEAGVAAIADLLRRFTPGVEPSRARPGVFWLDASGLQPLFASLVDWARGVQGRLRAAGFRGRVVVGFTRFGTYALARAGAGGERGAAVLEDAAVERRAAGRVPLRRLDVDPALRDALDALGVRTVGAFLRLPRGGVRRRFGREAYRLHREAAGDLTVPFHPAPTVEPLARHLDLDAPEADVQRLLFRVKEALDPLLERLAARRSALAGLELRLRLDAPAGAPRAERVERIRPAAPTLDVRQVLNLVHLRVAGLTLSAGVTEIDLTASPARASREQLRLFQEEARRDLRAADRAVARIRAEFGDGAVVRAALADGHLPEAAFAWLPLERVVRPAPKPAGVRPLVRRFFAAPRRTPPPRRGDPAGRAPPGAGDVRAAGLCGDIDETGRAPGVQGAGGGQAAGLCGPYVVSGGWWRTPIHREYYFAAGPGRAWNWVYYDRRRRAWFLQGAVE